MAGSRHLSGRTPRGRGIKRQGDGLWVIGYRSEFGGPDLRDQDPSNYYTEFSGLSDLNVPARAGDAGIKRKKKT